MPQTSASPSAPTAQTFAGLLAAIAAPASKRSSLVDLDSLEDDIATLSYERALNVHARYRAPQASDHSLTQPPESGGLRIFEAIPAEREAGLSAAADSGESQTLIADAPIFDRELPQPVDLQPALPPSRGLLERNLKTASITIRLSVEECDQLRARAADAGLTVSAYLRSCTFEAESLRAMVRDTMAQLRTESSREQASKLSPLASLFFRVMKPWSGSRDESQPTRARGSLALASFT